MIKPYLNLSDKVDKPIKLKTLNFSLVNQSVAYVLFENPNNTYKNYTLAITCLFEMKRLLADKVAK